METDKKITLKNFLKNRILWRVYFAWFMKRIVPLIAFQFLFFSVALQIFARNVFVSNVFKNAATVSDRGYFELLKYMTLSFFNTRPITQVAILIILGVIALLIRDFIRMAVTYRAMWIRSGAESKQKPF